MLSCKEIERAYPTNRSDKEENVLISPAATILIPEDYPKMFRGTYAHPDDYRIDNKPIKPHLFFYKPDTRIRLFLRISIKISENQFTAATFLLDTGCCPHFNMSPVLKNLISSRFVKSDIGPDYLVTKINEESAKCIVKEIHKPANVMGLPMFFLLGLSFQQNRVAAFEYDRDDIAHNVGTINDIKYI
jgi:hypothetical protein